MTAARICAFCGDPVDPLSRFTWRRVIGWERKAAATSRKGGSDIALRESRDEYACDVCISRQKNGLAPSQESFL
jgi:hypothetical protein